MRRNHGAEWVVLPLHELRQHQRLQLSFNEARQKRDGLRPVPLVLRDIECRSLAGFAAMRGYDLKILACVFRDNFRLARADGLVIYQVSAHTEGDSPCFEEIRRGSQRYAPCRDKFDLRQRSFEGLEIAGSAHGRTGEDLDRVRASFPGSNYLGRCKSTGKDRDIIAPAYLYSADVQRWTYDELRPGQHTSAGRFRIEDCACANQDAIAGFRGESADGVDGARHGHRDFENSDAAGFKSVGNLESFFFGVSAEDGDEADFADFL